MLIIREELAKIDSIIEKLNEARIKEDFLKECQEWDMEEITFIAEKGLILADSLNEKDRKRALRIAVILGEFNSFEGIYSIAYSLFNRLKYFPTNKLIKEKAKEELIDKLGFTEELVHIINEKKNTIKIAGEEYLFNDFQMKFYKLIHNNSMVSVSAPTSTGKSFFIKKVVVDMLLNGYDTVAYIVPTNALINEVMEDFREEIQKVQLKCVVTCSSEQEKIMDKEKVIFVLTQERLYQLCNNNRIFINVLIVDEAQNIMEGTRGILLEYSIKYAQRLWKEMKVIFISPLVNNPSRFIEDFGRKIGVKSEYLYQTEAGVVQNIIKLNKVWGGYKVILNNKVIKSKIGIKKNTGMCGDLANVILGFNNGRNSIVYCNTVQLTMNVCRKLYESGMYPRLGKKNLNAFADFVEYIIDEDYCLGEYIRRGIAWHYGDLPAFIRTGIEELAYEGELKIIASTSTLLQGVNIPAQNIYIYNPKKGKNRKMYSDDGESEEENQVEFSNLEFWNLAGRAGRMGKDFSGNIILIQNKEWEDTDRYDKSVNEVMFSTDKYQCVDYISRSFEDTVEQLGNREMREYIRSITMINKLYDIPIAKDLGALEYTILDKKVDQIIKDFNPPKELLIRLIGVGPEKIKQLWNTFIQRDNDIGSLMFVHPLNIEKDKKGAYIAHYMSIMQIINTDIMGGYLYKERELIKLAYMSYSWITEERLKNIIFYKSEDDNEQEIDISSKVKKQVKYLNNKIRFRLMKGVYIYQEVLKEYLRFTNREDMIQRMLNFPLYLEVGACRPVTIELISLGLMRDFAIELAKNNKYKIREKTIIEDLKKIDTGSIPNNYMRHKIEKFIMKL